ncbi:MAG: M15 family metallopeptidase [Cyclobacteriaceae bacterium]|nr:M15 family metallopeptidase [Cyclobacteriaceae bacterium]
MLKIASFLGLLVVSPFAVFAQVDFTKSLGSAPYTDSQRLQVDGFAKDFFISESTSTPAPVLETIDNWKNWKTVENYTFGKDRGNLTMIADLNALHPYFREKIITLINLCKAKGIELAVVESFRTHSKQNEYKYMGKRYTRTGGGGSKHQYGLAVDVVPVVDSVAQWDNAKLWRRVGAVGEQLGLRWGGRWKELYDPGHFEWSGGLSSYHLANGLFPKVPKSSLYPCLEEELVELVENWKAWEAEQSIIARKPRTDNPIELQPVFQNPAQSRPLASSKMK